MKLVISILAVLGIFAATNCSYALAAGDANPLNAAVLPSFRFPLEEQTPRLFDGGSAQEATVKNFPVSQNIAGVSMRLKPGALRELHWHANAAEWAYVIKGKCRITVIDPEKRVEVKDFGPGDIWYFPRGHGHSIQGLGDEECHFILVFDNGSFSDFATFSISDWLAHTPKEVLAKNFQTSANVFKDFPSKEVYIAQGPVPAPLPTDALPFTEISPPLTHKYSLGAQRGEIFNGGRFQVASQKQFPISTTMTGAIQTLKPGGLREMHWHPNADEWQYYISGHAHMTVFGSGGRAKMEDFGPGDVGYVPQGYGHYIENASDKEDCVTLVVLGSGNYEEISLSQWMASNTSQMLGTNFLVPKKIFESFPQNNPLITDGKKNQ
ncbi:MAG: cupin domain-containing protein [Candidatus Obscuribacterales bacterium]|nr:cupin domain-containing protein [Candidatus Obscuribacterales bacterium]